MQWQAKQANTKKKWKKEIYSRKQDQTKNSGINPDTCIMYIVMSSHL
jgi:hypothetical protein